MGAHKLRIETGRYSNLKPEERKCLHCNTNAIEDEKHFLLECNQYNTERKHMIEIIEKQNIHCEDNDILLCTIKYITNCFSKA